MESSSRLGASPAGHNPLIIISMVSRCLPSRVSGSSGSNPGSPVLGSLALPSKLFACLLDEYIGLFKYFTIYRPTSLSAQNKIVTRFSLFTLDSKWLWHLCGKPYPRSHIQSESFIIFRSDLSIFLFYGCLLDGPLTFCIFCKIVAR